MELFTFQRQLGDFLAEDLGQGDLTTEAIFPPQQMATAVFTAKSDFIAAGMERVAAAVFRFCDPACLCTDLAADGARVAAGARLLTVRGPVRALLQGERVALNLVQRLSGIATLTAAFVAQVAGLEARIVDTRKTTPGLRALEKYAVRVGGGHNHRLGLDGGILIKDNHIAACGSIRRAVELSRARAPHTLKIEVEAESLTQVEECLACGVEIIMLDNMDLAQMRAAVKLVAGRALVEASGGMKLATVRAVAETGVNVISVGALTHSAPAADISMRLTVENGVTPSRQAAKN